MKAKIYSLLIIVLLAFTFSTPVSAATVNGNTPEKEYSEEEIAMRMNQMRQRVEEIKKLDKSTLNKQERRALRKELKNMNKEARAIGQGGVYLSVGAIIIIILLLILIL